MKYGLVFLLFVLSSCVTDRQLGDKEFKLDNYKKALEYYDLEISAGSKDPEVFAQAARASIQLGSFGTAERYYGKAISNGAEIGVARELAKFYIRTSNYGSAIRVYKYLLSAEKEKQPVYNNLGTAFLYSGSPFDAESYLLIAQQMDPSDPFPYLNLGLLYDQNLKQWPKAIGFYQCFMELAPNHESTPSVNQRLGEIVKKSSTEGKIDCTVPYREPAKTVSIKEMRILVDLDIENFNKTKKTPISLDDNPGLPSKKVEIVNLKSKLAIEFEPTPEMKPATTLYMNHEFEGAVKEFEKLPMKSFDANAALAFGDSLSRLFRFSDATIWLQLSNKLRSQPKTVELLILAFNNMGKKSDMKFWCEKYKGRPAYQGALSQCPALTVVKEKPVTKKDVEKKPEETSSEPSSK